MRDIESEVALEKYEISRAAKRLREAGLVARSDHATDRRLVSLSLTERGKEVMAELLPLAKAHQAEIERRLGDALAGLEAGLDRLLKDEG